MALVDDVEPVVVGKDAGADHLVAGQPDTGRGHGIPDAFHLDRALTEPFAGVQVIADLLQGHVGHGPAGRFKQLLNVEHRDELGVFFLAPFGKAPSFDFAPADELGRLNGQVRSGSQCFSAKVGSFGGTVANLAAFFCVVDVADEVLREPGELTGSAFVPLVEHSSTFGSPVEDGLLDRLDGLVVLARVVAAGVGAVHGDEVVEDVEPDRACAGRVDPDELPPAHLPWTFFRGCLEREQRVVGRRRFVLDDAASEQRRP